jgi:hypothetical protein
MYARDTAVEGDSQRQQPVPIVLDQGQELPVAKLRMRRLLACSGPPLLHCPLTSARNRVFCSPGVGHLPCHRLTCEVGYCTANEKPGFFLTLLQPYLRSVSTGLIVVTAVYLWQIYVLGMREDLGAGRGRRSGLACAAAEGLASAG